MRPIALALAAGLALAFAGPVPAANQEHHEAGCLAGTLAGALFGGLVGSSFGKGHGKTAATAVGAGLGTVAGNNLACK